MRIIFKKHRHAYGISVLGHTVPLVAEVYSIVMVTLHLLLESNFC